MREAGGQETYRKSARRSHRDCGRPWRRFAERFRNPASTLMLMEAASP